MGGGGGIQRGRERLWWRREEEGLESCAVGRSVGQSVGGRDDKQAEAHVSQPIRSVLSRDRDLVLCGEAGLGGLLKVELLEAVEWRGESESCGRRGERERRGEKCRKGGVGDEVK